MRPVTILYASPETHVLHEIFEAASYSLLAIFLVAAFTVLLLGIFLRRALRPLEELAAAASQVSVPSLRFEPPVSVLQVRELRPLAEVLTEFIARLRDSFQKEQRFLGDAAHELKTAVAVVRSSLQVLMLKRRSQEEYAAGLDRVLEDNVRVESLVTKMLELANITEAHRPDTMALDLSEVAAEVAGNLEPLAEEKGSSIRTTCSSDAMVRLSREHARMLMSNLVVNAIQHSVAGMVVDLAVQRQDADKVVVKVADLGTGIGEGAFAPHLRSLLSRGPIPLTGDRRHRSGAFHLQIDSRLHRRNHSCSKPAQRWHNHDHRPPLRVSPSAADQATRTTKSHPRAFNLWNRLPSFAALAAD